MNTKIAISLLVILVTVQAGQFMHLEFFQYCRALGYPVEDHIIPTEDHYNLQFYRLQAKNTEIVKDKKVIYLQHGLVDSSDTWIVNDEELAPAFFFANRGYDVWVGNSRGNRYSKKEMSPSVLKFWDFTFDDMAQKDLPAAFTYINRITNNKIHYVGHSQGTLIMFIALSLGLQAVSDNLLSFHAFGPVAYINKQKSKVMTSLAKSNLSGFLNRNRIKEVFLVNKGGLRTGSLVCKQTPLVCWQGLRQISQMNNTVNNLQRLPTIFAHFPSGSSTKNFMQYGQYIKTGEFKKFDYGEKKNMVIYGQKKPPLYSLSNIKFPVHLYVGKYDKLADTEDAKHLFQELRSSQGKTSKTYNFGHATFVWGKSKEHLEDVLSRIEGMELNDS